MYDSLFASSDQNDGHLINFPDEVSAIADEKYIRLTAIGKERWRYQDVVVNLNNRSTGTAVTIEAPDVRLSQVTLKWIILGKKSLSILNDHWERTYGDILWHKPLESEILPWYFMELNDKSNSGIGVRTGANAFCFWKMGYNNVTLTLDTRSGGKGVQLGDRQLKAAEIVTIQSTSDESPFQTAVRFTKIMCGGARMPKEPVYGINDWYFTYGNNSEKLISEHTELMVPMAEGLENRPFSVIDAGWFQKSPSLKNDCCWGENMNTPNSKFGDMGRLAEKIRQTGMRPGIWTRPLCGSNKDPDSLKLPLIKGREKNKPVLDPTIPENLERIKNYFKLYNQWSYELVKFDFTSFDIFGKWGFAMIKDGSMTSAGWSMNDTSITNAEIVLNLYQTIRAAAGETYLIGCNTFGHLAAGIFELNRIGDDTSGNDWERTVKMGVNTLAFRGIQHGVFYAADADCVGLTTKIPWDKNEQWMQLVAKSGTPLFISAQPDATGARQKEVIRECFRMASQNLPLGEPLDWIESAFPQKWKLNEKVETFNWK